MSLAEDDDEVPKRHRHVRFEPTITVGNLISVVVIISMAIGGFYKVTGSFEDKVSTVTRLTSDRLNNQATRISLVEQKTDANAAAIAQDRADARDFRTEMRGSFGTIAEQIAKLREDLARYGALPKSH